MIVLESARKRPVGFFKARGVVQDSHQAPTEVVSIVVVLGSTIPLKTAQGMTGSLENGRAKERLIGEAPEHGAAKTPRQTEASAFKC